MMSGLNSQLLKISFSMEVLWSLPVAWENQKRPKKGELTLEMEEKREDLSQLPFSESASCQCIVKRKKWWRSDKPSQIASHGETDPKTKVADFEETTRKMSLIVTKQIASDLRSQHWYGAIYCLTIKIKITSRFYVFYDVSL